MIPVEQYIGIPWKPDGRSFDGVDCYGLVWLWYMGKLGIILPIHAPHAKSVYDRGMEGWIRVEFGNEKENDILLMHQRDNRLHAAIVLERGKMLHIREGRTSTVERYKPQIISRFTEVYRCRSC